MADSPTETDGYHVRAVVRAVAILELLRDSDGAVSLNELARRSGMAKASVFRMLRSLEKTGMVERVPGRNVYRLGVRCLALGQAYLEQTDLRSEAAFALERLRNEFDETVHLGVLDGEYRVVYLEKLETSQAVGVKMSRVGLSTASHCTSLGKALLAEQEGDPVAELEQRGALKRYTPNTITEPDALQAELAETRRRGYSLDFEEHEPGVRCVAATVPGPGGEALAAVSVSTPAQRMPEELLRGELAAATMIAAQEIGRRLGGVPRAGESTA